MHAAPAARARHRNDTQPDSQQDQDSIAPADQLSTGRLSSHWQQRPGGGGPGRPAHCWLTCRRQRGRGSRAHDATRASSRLPPCFGRVLASARPDAGRLVAPLCLGAARCGRRSLGAGTSCPRSAAGSAAAPRAQPSLSGKLDVARPTEVGQERRAWDRLGERPPGAQGNSLQIPAAKQVAAAGRAPTAGWDPG